MTLPTLTPGWQRISGDPLRTNRPRAKCALAEVAEMSKPRQTGHKTQMGRGANRKGRSKRSARFVMLRHWLLNSPAWLSLGPAARVLYLALKQRFNGSNNGRIGMSVRDAARELHISKDTVSKALRELEERGFVKAAQRGNFNWKKRHASEWILTEESCRDELPTKDFMRWQPEEKKAGPKRRTPGPDPGTKAVTEPTICAATVPEQGPTTIN